MMLRKTPPGIDTALGPVQGTTRDGQPLSYNRAPAADLAPWISRLYVSKITAPADYVLSCGLLCDTATVRIQPAGEWQALTADGPCTVGNEPLFLGPQTRLMPVSVKGSFISVGMAIRPGACSALHGPRVGDFLDRLVPASAVMLPSDPVLPAMDPDTPPEDWLTALENHVRRRVEDMGRPLPDPLTRQFELICMRDPAISVAEAAKECGVDRRKLERVVGRDFGQPPKQVLRRARALDMASYLRGVADMNEADAIMLRYYDESHLIHEFTQLFGMAPRQFVQTPQPILTLVLEARQARRLEALERIVPGEARPWQ